MSVVPWPSRLVTVVVGMRRWWFGGLGHVLIAVDLAVRRPLSMVVGRVVLVITIMFSSCLMFWVRRSRTLGFRVLRGFSGIAVIMGRRIMVVMVPVRLMGLLGLGVRFAWL